jgi:hypothetical protein
VFRWLLLGVFLALATLMCAAAFVVQQFGWPGLLGVMVAFATFAYVLAHFLPRMLFASLTQPLRRRGQILEGSTVRVNAFVPAEAPDAFDESSYDEGDFPSSIHEFQKARGRMMQAVDWFTLDVTITPPSSLGADPENLTGKKWQPDALIIVSADRDNSPLPDFMGGLANLAGGGICVVVEKLLWDGLEFVPHDGEEVWGIQRMRLHLGIPESVQRIAFVYQMFARFGNIPVPSRDRT